ncbi:hypothetical protein D3C80_2167250 [compost metagenome]
MDGEIDREYPWPRCRQTFQGPADIDREYFVWRGYKAGGNIRLPAACAVSEGDADDGAGNGAVVRIG